ncbi:phage holin family protein [Helicobacter sp. T3_23-1059]
MSEFEAFIAKGLYLELLPIIVLGVFAGLAKFFQRDDDPKHTAGLRDFFNNTIASMVICVIIYAALDSTDLSYLTKFAISGLVAFLGIDKALDYAQKLLSLRKGGNND